MNVGDHVMGGSTPEDFDHGFVLEVDRARARVRVAWEQSQVETWVEVDDLQAYDQETAIHETHAAIERADERRMPCTWRYHPSEEGEPR